RADDHPQQQQPEHGSPAKGFAKPKMKFDLESQQHVHHEDASQASAASRYSKPQTKTYDNNDNVSQHSQSSPAAHFSRPNPHSYMDDPYDAPEARFTAPKQQQPGLLNRNSQSF